MDDTHAKETSTTHSIVDALTRAIVEHRLLPGAKLAEQKLADHFGVSRTLVRQALFQLAQNRLIKLEPARGAFVAAPSVEEARQVFAVRRMIELEMTRTFVRELNPQRLKALKEHVAQERAAVLRGDVPGRTELLGDFHVHMAQLLGNQVLAQILNELISRCALITLMYQSSRAAEHSTEEHVALIAAIEADQPTTRLNDGRLDRQGRFVFGTMDEAPDGPSPLGHLWSYDGQSSPRCLLNDVRISNSIAFSPDGHLMYFADTPNRRIDVFDYDGATGTPSNRRVFVQLGSDAGYPDGSTVDSEGYLWNAEWDGGRVVRYDPKGRIDRVITLPVPLKVVSKLPSVLYRATAKSSLLLALRENPTATILPSLCIATP